MAFFLADKDRCAFGLGWEHRRRGKTIDANPFPRGTYRWKAYRDGWNKFQTPSAATYHEPNVISTLDMESRF